ncbi:GreA/GreB family elongation factor, partial [Candidatus Parcubacteria bacterium]|nr:GreA/GreB family elongation factor [Candidatus Parcubacteria bacterium]
VSVGSMVKVQKDRAPAPTSFTIVGSEEADMKNGKISVRSPFGEAIIGKKKGDSFTFATPTGKATYKILSIQ